MAISARTRTRRSPPEQLSSGFTEGVPEARRRSFGVEGMNQRGPVHEDRAPLLFARCATRLFAPQPQVPLAVEAPPMLPFK